MIVLYGSYNTVRVTTRTHFRHSFYYRGQEGSGGEKKNRFCQKSKQIAFE